MDSLTVFCNYFTHLCGHFLIESKVGLELLCKTSTDQIDLFFTVESKLEIAGFNKVFQFFHKAKK